MVLTKTLQNMLKKDLTFQTMKYTDRCLKEKNEKVSGLMKDELEGQIMK